MEVTQAEITGITDYKVHVGNSGDQTVPADVAADRRYYSAANERSSANSYPATGKVSKVRAQHQTQVWFKRLGPARLRAAKAKAEGAKEAQARRAG